MKPGLYVATVNGEPDAVVYGPMGNGQMVRLGAPWRSDGRVQYLASGSIADARPLVVVDPEDLDLPVAHALWEMMEDLGTREFNAVRERIRGVLRALADPKPAEPTGLGAVVRDRDGRIWVRTDVPDLAWVHTSPVADPMEFRWADLDVAEVLSEGWSE